MYIGFSYRYKVNISDDIICQTLYDINGFEPTSWFIARNVGKDRKQTFAYIVNNTPEYIQLVPLKGNQKQGYIDKENIIVLNKATDIEKCVILQTDYYRIKINIINGIKLEFLAYYFGSTKHQRESIKAFQKEYKKSSRPSQTLWNIFIVIVFVLSVIFGYNATREIIDQTNYLKNEQKVVEEVAETFEQTKAFINLPEYKDVFSLKIQPFESDAEVSGNIKVVELNSFRFTVDKNAEFHKFDNGGDYAYVLGGENTTLGTGYIDTYNREDEVLQKNEAVYEKVKNGTLEKMGYSMKSYYDMTKTKYMIDYFSDDINNFNLYEQIMFNYIVSDRISECDDSQKTLAVYEKEFDSYYMIVEKVQYNDIAEDVVYNYHIYIYFKNDLNTVETYSITNLNHTEEECFAIINSMELIEE